MTDLQVFDKHPPRVEYQSADLVGDRFEALLSSLSPRRMDKECLVLLHGVDETGQSVAAQVRGFRPYLYFASAGLTSTVAELSKATGVSKQWFEETWQYKKAAHFTGWQPTSADDSSVKTHSLVRIYFPNTWTFRRAAKMEHLTPIEGKVDPVTQFLKETGTKTGGWVDISAPIHVSGHNFMTHANVELETELTCLRGVDLTAIPPFLTASVDIECVSATGDFPDWRNSGDEIVFIGLVLWRYGTAESSAQKYIFCTGSCDASDGIGILRYPTEGEMLRAYRDFLVVHADPDVILGYNTFGFDYRYMWNRAKALRVPGFAHMSRVVVDACDGRERALSSNQNGQAEIFEVNTGGRIHVDLYLWMTKNRNLSSYKLDDVSSLYLQAEKIHLDPNEHYRALARMCRDDVGSEKAQVAAYCVQDCMLPLRLAIELEVFEGYISMSRITSTLWQRLVAGGQQQKVYNLIAIFAYSEQPMRVLNDPPPSSDAEDGEVGQYEGATVIDPIKGFYRDPVVTLDFASLYPSIIRTHNLCPSTLVLDPAHIGMDGVETTTHVISEGMEFTFVTSQQGIVPKILTHLDSERSRVKRLMKQEKDPKKYAVLNAEQLALKVTANSCYGFFGAVLMGKMPCLPIAVTTTYIGRCMIRRTKEIAESMYNCVVVYGDTDSVFVHFEDSPSYAIAGERGDHLAQHISDVFGGVIVLEFEKQYKPILLIAKKRYIGLIRYGGDDGDKSKLDAKGVELVRRDNCAVAKRVYTDVMNAIIYDIDADKSILQLRGHLERIVTGQVPMADFVLSKQLKGSYKSDALPHVAVVGQMRARAPGSEPKIGDRVPFVYVERENATKAFEKAEDPAYAALHELKIDYLHYVESQIVKPITSLMSCFVSDIKSLFLPYIHRLENTKNRQKTLDGYSSCVLPTGSGSVAAPSVDLSHLLARPTLKRPRGVKKR